MTVRIEHFQVCSRIIQRFTKTVYYFKIDIRFAYRRIFIDSACIQDHIAIIRYIASPATFIVLRTDNKRNDKFTSKQRKNVTLTHKALVTFVNTAELLLTSQCLNIAAE